MIERLLRSILAGLILAGLVHAITVLRIPDVAPADAVDRIERAAKSGRVSIIPADGSVLPDLDPFFVHAACPFDLEKGAVRLSGSMPSTLWTLAVAVKPIGIVTSLEPAALPAGDLDVTVIAADEAEPLETTQSAEAQSAFKIAAARGRGFILLRAFAPDDKARAEKTGTLQALRCTLLKAS